MIKGLGASWGIAIAKALVIGENKLEIVKCDVEDFSKELQKLKEALEQAKVQLNKIKDSANEKLGAEKAQIFEAHLMMLEDPEFIGSIEKKIQNEKVNAEYAVKTVSEELATIFEMMDNEYMMERAADIRDVSKRVLSIIMGVNTGAISEIDEECIIVTKDLTPSDTAQIDKEKVLAFVTEIGGSTSHSAIIARSMEIPAIVGVGSKLGDINNGDLIIVDGEAGAIIVNPDEATIKEYEVKKQKFVEYKNELLKYLNEESITVDGRKVEIAANIGNVDDAEEALSKGAEAVGLFRTEFLYMSTEELPSEEVQYEAYKNVLEKMDGKPVIIRTLDIGGDKELAYLPMDKEMNPFLGYRAIRLCLDRKDIFKTQLRALLRASVCGKLRIMFPMISGIEELRNAKAVLEECRVELKNEGIAFADKIEIGIMIEIPSAAVMSDLLAKEVDFFSIGTNDLIQYTVAVDRMNEKISYLYDFCNPGVLRLIKMVIDNAHKEGKFVGMCGEMAGNPQLIPVLLGMGLDEFSMSASAVLNSRKVLRGLSYENSKVLADKVMQCGTVEEIKTLIAESVK